MWQTCSAMSKSGRTRESTRAAFVRGVWLGLAGPSLLYSGHEALAQLKAAEFVPLPKRQASAASDWARVGNELRAAAKTLRQPGG